MSRKRSSEKSDAQLVAGHSRHRDRNGKLKKLPRQWHDGKIKAGYHEQEWGEYSHPRHELHGTYRTKQTKELFLPDPNGKTREDFEPATIPNPDNPLEQITVYRKLGRPEMTSVHVPVTVTVRHLEVGPTGGPEFELEWSDGFMVTVMDDRTALQYLVACGAAEPAEDQTAKA